MTAHEPLTLENLDITSAKLFGETGYPWAAWDLLRREAPVFRHQHYNPSGVDDVGPVWIITKNADIQEITKNPGLFSQVHRANRPPDTMTRHLLALDPPEHAVYRNIFSRRFTPRAIAQITPRLEEISSETIEGVVDRLLDRVTGEGECDFVYDLSMRLPVYTICELLGVPREDAEMMFHWTNESLSPSDPEFQNGRTVDETRLHGTRCITAYFSKLAEERRSDPRDDLMTVLVQARIDDQPIPMQDLLENAWLLLVGGNETTRNVTTGGMLALIEHPDEMARLRADLGLIQVATEEFLRWVSPIVATGRQATRDTAIRGQEIKARDQLQLYLPSANRDEDVFEDPYRFDITRDPNPHVAFSGYGEHFCIGANLARQEIYTAIPMVLERFSEIELAGKPARAESSIVAGIKRMPVKLKTRKVFAGA